MELKSSTPRSHKPATDPEYGVDESIKHLCIYSS
jgi:hypothetical protein